MLHINNIRNFGILAHIDSGKTTLSERILRYTGSIHHMVEVHQHGAHMDSDALERLKGITIGAAVTTVTWKSHQLNLIDTPGHVDFTAEVERSCRVLDGAVMVFCAVSGVQAQSETVWRQADRYQVPRMIIINKMDREGADFDRVVEEIRDRLQAQPVVCSIPIGSAQDFEGVIDLRTMQAVYFDGKEGIELRYEAIPESDQERALQWRMALCEFLATDDESLLDAFIEQNDLSLDQIDAALARACHAGRAQPLFAASALGNKGVQLALDGIIQYLPNPTEVPMEQVFNEACSDDATDGERLSCDPSLPLRALVFKLDAQKHGDVAYVRVYQGTLTPGMQLLAVNAQSMQGHTERIQRLVRLDSDKLTTVSSISAGDLCAVIGCKQVRTGDTLTHDPVYLSGIQFADSVIEMAIEPETGVEADALAKALARTAKEDPTFSYRTDSETGQLLIAGMGELHLEVIVHRLQERHHVNVRMGKPQVSYRSRITQAYCERFVVKKQNGGPGSYAIAEIAFRPLHEDEIESNEDAFVFENRVRGGAIKREYIPAVEQGIRDALNAGVDGISIHGVHACLLDGHTHEQDSSEFSFREVGRKAVRESLDTLGIEITEPWMRVHVECPADDAGLIIGSINARRGLVLQVEAKTYASFIHAEAPLAELFGYILDVRGLTGGRGNFTMEPIGYRVK